MSFYSEQRPQTESKLEQCRIILNSRKFMSTISIFLTEIPDFLSDEECDYLIAKADEEGMRTSIARGGLTELDHWKFHSSSKSKSYSVMPPQEE